MLQRSLVVAAALVLAALLPAETSAGALRSPRNLDGGVVLTEDGDTTTSADFTDSSSGEMDETLDRILVTKARDDKVVEEEAAAQVRAPVQEDADEAAEDAENEVLPPNPAPASEDQMKLVDPGQPWESRFRHGVAPAKLPALETDNAHGYRHSIIHPYGDDLHA